MSKRKLAVNRGYVQFVVPTYILFVLLTIVPVLGSIGLSSFQFDIAMPTESIFIGIENYLDLFEDDEFINSLKVMCISVSYTHLRAHET